MRSRHTNTPRTLHFKGAPDGLPHELFSQKNGTRSRARDDRLQSFQWPLVSFLSRTITSNRHQLSLQRSNNLRLPKLLSGLMLVHSALYTLYTTGYSAQGIFLEA